MLLQLLYKSRTFRATVNFALTVASILIAMSVVELGLRLTTYGKMHFQPRNAYGFFPRFYHRADPVNGYDITANFPATELIHRDYIEMVGAPFTVSSNELGCRDKDIAQGSPYVLLLGDSFTWANVPIEQAFGSVLQQVTGMRILNCGVSGYGTAHEHYKLKQIVTRLGAPRAIIMGYFVGNDLIDDYLYPEYTVVDGYLVNKITFADEKSDLHKTRIYTENELREQILQHLPKPPANTLLRFKDYLSSEYLVYNIVKDNTELRKIASKVGLADPPVPPADIQKRAEEVFHSPDGYPWLRKAWRMHLDNLRQLKKTADNQNSQLLIVLIPSQEQVYDFLRPVEEGLDWEYPNKRLAEFFNGEGIHFLDLLPEFRSRANLQPRPTLDPVKDLYWRYDYHLNVKGNRLAGLLIGRHLLEQSMLDVLEKEKRLTEIKHLLDVSADASIP